MVYYSNKAAVYFEMQMFDQCIEQCDKAIECARNTEKYDYVKLAKALARKANAYLQLGKHDEAIENFENALIENQDQGIKMQLYKALKIK